MRVSVGVGVRVRCPRTACLRRGPKIIYSYYTRCALIIRDRQPTAWDDFAHPAEACIGKVSHQIVVGLPLTPHLLVSTAAATGKAIKLL